jgi:hypothetical protein
VSAIACRRRGPKPTKNTQIKFEVAARRDAASAHLCFFSLVELGVVPAFGSGAIPLALPWVEAFLVVHVHAAQARGSMSGSRRRASAPQAHVRRIYKACHLDDSAMCEQCYTQTLLERELLKRTRGCSCWRHMQHDLLMRLGGAVIFDQHEARNVARQCWSDIATSSSRGERVLCGLARRGQSESLA